MRRRARCLLPALVLLAGFVATVALYAWGGDAYFDLREMAGLKPFPPFLDLHNIIAAIDCWQEGVDVYHTNPCDLLGRPHIYSPLWLRLPWLLGDPGLLHPIGIAMDLAFVVAVAMLPCPAGWRQRAAMLLGVVSPDTAYAMERANVDVLIFTAVTLGTLLLAGRLAARVAGHGLFLAMGLLKFYPLVLLALMLRERPRVALALLAGAGAVVLLAVLPLAGEFRVALAGIYPHPWFSGTFGAGQLPGGVAQRMGEGPALAMVFWLGLAGAAAVATWRLGRDPALAARLASLPTHQSNMLLAGALLICGCFLAGQSVEYRAIFLLLALPALLHLAGGGARAGVFALASAAVVLLMWEPVLRRLVAHGWPASGLVLSPPSFALWLAREALWWLLVAVLLALVAAAVRRAWMGGLTRDGMARP